MSPVPYSDNWTDDHEGALLVSGPGGLGPLMTMRLRLLDFSRSGHQSTHPFPICDYNFPDIPSYSQFASAEPICLRVDDVARFRGVPGPTNCKLDTS